MPGSGTNKSFTVFRSAAEEAEMKRDEHGWDNEGGHMSSTAGRVTRTQRTKLPYMVTLAHHQSDETRHSFASMRRRRRSSNAIRPCLAPSCPRHTTGQRLSAGIVV